MPAEPVLPRGASGGLPQTWTSSVERTDAALVVRLAGELDYAGTRQLERLLAEVLDSAPDMVVLDLAEVRFCDSSSLQVLLRAATRAATDVIGFGLARVPRVVARPIQVLGLVRQLPGYETVEAAVVALS